jgi:hypothetical protein
MNRAVKIILAVVVILAVAGGSFYVGTVYARNQIQSQFAARAGGFPGAGGANGQPGAFVFQGDGPNGQRGNQQGGMTFGTIEQIGDGTLTIKDQNGKETQVKVTDTTLIEKNASVSLSDLTEGETVIVSGSPAADGSITARSVQVAPAGRFGPGAPPPNGTPVAPAQ